MEDICIYFAKGVDYLKKVEYGYCRKVTCKANCKGNLSKCEFKEDYYEDRRERFETRDD